MQWLVRRTASECGFDRLQLWPLNHEPASLAAAVCRVLPLSVLGPAGPGTNRLVISADLEFEEALNKGLERITPVDDNEAEW